MSDDDRPDNDNEYRHGEWTEVTPIGIASPPGDNRDLLNYKTRTNNDDIPSVGHILFFHFDKNKRRLTVYGVKRKKLECALGLVRPDELTLSRYIPLQNRQNNASLPEEDGWYFDPCAFCDVRLGSVDGLISRLDIMGHILRTARAPGENTQTLRYISTRIDAAFPAHTEDGRYKEAYAKAGAFFLAIVNRTARTTLANAEGHMERLFLERHCPDEWRLLDVGISRHEEYAEGGGAASPFFMLDRRKTQSWNCHHNQKQFLHGLRIFGKDACAYTRLGDDFYCATNVNNPTERYLKAPDKLRAHLNSAISRYQHVWDSDKRPLIVFSVPAEDALGLCEMVCAKCKVQCRRMRPVIYRGEALLIRDDVVAAAKYAVSQSFTTLVSVIEQLTGATCFTKLHVVDIATKESTDQYLAYVDTLAANQDVRPYDREVTPTNTVEQVALNRAYHGMEQVVIPRYQEAHANLQLINPVALSEVLSSAVVAACTKFVDSSTDQYASGVGPTAWTQRGGLPGSQELMEADYNIEVLADLMPPCIRAIVRKSLSEEHPKYHERCLLGSFLLDFDIFSPMIRDGCAKDEIDTARRAFTAVWKRLFNKHSDPKTRSLVQSNFPITEYGNQLIKNLVKMRKEKGVFHGCQFAIKNGVCPFAGGDSAQFCQRTGIEYTSALVKQVFDIAPAIGTCGTDLCMQRCARFFMADNGTPPRNIVRCPSTYYRYSHANKRLR